MYKLERKKKSDECSCVHPPPAKKFDNSKHNQGLILNIKYYVFYRLYFTSNLPILWRMEKNYTGKIIHINTSILL